MLSNPLLLKELRLALRHGRPFWVMGAYVAVLALVVAYVYPTGEIRLEAGKNPEEGRKIFEAFTLAQALLVLLLTPAIASTVLTIERERQTLESLLVSGLSIMDIVVGKFFYSLFHIFLLMVSSLPLTSVCFLLGGVSPGELVAAYGVLLLAAAVMAAASVLCSSHFHRSYAATAVSYLTVPLVGAVTFCFGALGTVLTIPFTGLAIVGALVRWWARKPSRSQAVVVITAVVIIGALLIGGALWLIANGYWDSIQYVVMLAVFMPGTALLCWLCLSTAGVALQRLPEPRVPARRRWETVFRGQGTQGSRQSAVGSRQLPVTSDQSPVNTPHAIRRRQAATYGVRPFISEQANPVFAKEMRASLFGKKDTLIRALLFSTITVELLLLLLCFSPEFVMNGEPLFRSWAMLDLIGVMTVGAAFAALSLSVEREQRTLPLLFTTPLSSRVIVGGKFCAVAFYTSYVITASVPVVGFCLFLDIIPLKEAVVFFVAQVVYGAAAVGAGLLCSVLCNQSRRALGWALGGVFTLMLGSLFLPLVTPYNWQALVSNVMDMGTLPFLALYVLLPLTCASNAFAFLAPRAHAGLSPTFSAEHLMLWGASMLVYLAIAVACYGLAVWVFDRWVRRAE